MLLVSGGSKHLRVHSTAPTPNTCLAQYIHNAKVAKLHQAYSLILFSSRSVALLETIPFIHSWFCPSPELWCKCYESRNLACLCRCCISSICYGAWYLVETLKVLVELINLSVNKFREKLWVMHGGRVWWLFEHVLGLYTWWKGYDPTVTNVINEHRANMHSLVENSQCKHILLFLCV